MTRPFSMLTFTALLACAVSPLLGQESTITLPAPGNMLELTVDHPEEMRAGRSYPYELTVRNLSDTMAIHDLQIEQRSESRMQIESATIDGQQVKVSQKNSGDKESSDNGSSKKNSNNSNNKSSNENKKSNNKNSKPAYGWTISELPPGATKVVKLQAVVDGEGELGLCFGVTSYTPTLCIAPRFVKPDVQLSKSVPDKVNLCDVIHIEYLVTNSGTGNPGTFEIVDDLGELQTESGDKTLRFKVDGLEAGETRKFIADVIATRPGEYQSRAEAILRDEEKVKSEMVSTRVESPDLAIAIDGPAIAYADQPVVFTVRVTNQGNVAAEGAELEVAFPTALQLVGTSDPRTSGNTVNLNKDSQGDSGQTPTLAKSASENGSEESSKSSNNDDGISMDRRTLTLGTLQVDQTKELTLTLRGELSQEQFPIRAKSKFICRPGSSETEYEVVASTVANTKLVSLPALMIAVVDKQDPIRTGDEVVYEIVVRNQGTATDENVQVVAELPSKLEFISASGTTESKNGNGQGSVNEITFGKISKFEPGDRAEWQVRAKATDRGDAIFKVRLTSKSVSTETTTEEPTKLFGAQ